MGHIHDACGSTGVHNFPKNLRVHLKILGTRRVTRSKFHAECLLILGITVQNSFSWDLGIPGVERKDYIILIGWPEQKRPFCGPKCRLEDNIKVALKDTGHEGMDSSWLKVVKLKLWILWIVGNITSGVTIRIWRVASFMVLVEGMLLYIFIDNVTNEQLYLSENFTVEFAWDNSAIIQNPSHSYITVVRV